MNPDIFKSICDGISSSGDKQSFMKKVLGSIKSNLGNSTQFILTIEDPPEYSIEDASVPSWTGNIAGKTVGVKLYSASSLDRIPPWSTSAAENATDPAAAPSNPDAVVRADPSPSHQTQDDRGQLKWQ